MDSSKPTTFFLRSTSAVTLNERFSGVLLNQLTQSGMVTFDPVLLQQRVSGPPPVVLLVKKEQSSLQGLQDTVSELVPGASPRVKQCLRRRRNVWTRLGWKRFTHRISASKPRGFWSFRNKYRWRSRFTSTYRRRRHLQSRLGCCLLTGTNIQNLAAGQHLRRHLQRGGAGPSKGRRRSRRDVPTRKQLDAQLDEYMSLSKSRLDQQLDDYMSMSRRRLDAELDEYMTMVGETELHWD